MSPATRRATSAFRHRNYRLFFTGQGISLIGTWMQTVAQAWLVLQLTSDPLWLGVVAAAQFIPVLVFGLFAGVYADSLPKRKTLIATQAIKMALSTILAVLAFSDTATIPLLIVLALAIGTVNAVDMPVRQAFSVEMVGREDIGNAVALNSAMFNGARVIGPAVAGITIGLVGVPWAFTIDALSFLAVIVALALMRDSELLSPARIARPESVSDVMVQLREGLSYVRRTPIVLMSLLVIGLVSAFGMNFSVVIPPLAEDVLHSGATGYGFLMAASGLGSLLAALTLAFRGAARPAFIGIGAMILGRVRDRARLVDRLRALDGPDVRGRLRRDPDGGDRQHDRPAGGARWPARPRHERLHHDLRRLHADRRADHGRHRLALRDRDLAGGRRRPLVRDRRRGAGLDAPQRAGPDPAPERRRRRRRRPRADGDRAGARPRAGSRSRSARADGRAGGQPAGSPKTRAALSPPNPNEVDSTRR